jgi:hypothetical protein
MFGPNSATLATCDPIGVHHLHDELCAIKEDAKRAISYGRASGTTTSWTIWSDFCLSLSCDPLLHDIDDPMPLLQIFAARYRVGTLAPSQSAVRSRTVEDALHAVGQTLASMGYPDPCLQASG